MHGASHAARGASCTPHPQSAGSGPFITAADLLDPRTADFTNPADADVVAPVLRRICAEYDAYEQSGSTAWDQTLDVAKRPAWMRALTGTAAPTAPGRPGTGRVQVQPCSL